MSGADEAPAGRAGGAGGRLLLVLAGLAIAGGAAWMLREPLLAALRGGPDPATADLPALQAEADRLHAGEDHARSEQAYALAAEAALAQGDLRAHWANRAQRAVCLKFLSRTAEARAELLPALAWARANDDPRIEGLALGNLVRLAAIDGDQASQAGWYDELVAFAEARDDRRLVVHTLEQAGTLAQVTGDWQRALALLDRALALDPGLPEDERRSDALLRQKALTLADAGDDEGAVATWDAAPPSGAARANQARHLARLGLHGRAAEVAEQAALLFEEEGEGRRDERDRALLLSLSEHLRAGELELVDERLQRVRGSGGEPAALAPFDVLAARLLLARGDPAGAVLALERAAPHLSGTAAHEAAWLSAVALLRSGRPDDALEALSAAPDSLASTVLAGWILSALDGRQEGAFARLPLLDPLADHSRDESLPRLLELCPERLPSPAWLALHLSLADADALRREGRADAADLAADEGLLAALRWQTLEALQRVAGRFPEPARVVEALDAVAGWVAGVLPDDTAVIAVLPGPAHGYLALCTAGRGGSSFGLPPQAVLADRVRAVTDAVRAGSIYACAGAAHRLFTTLFDERARGDLAGTTHWWMLLPDLLTPVPPAMLVPTEPAPGTPVPWLVREVAVTLLPHAPLGDAWRTGPAGADGEAGAAPPPRLPWAQLGEPVLDASRASLAATWIAASYGEEALAAGPLRTVADGPRVTAASATAGALLELAARTDVLEVAAPAFGGHRLGGVLLSPEPQAEDGGARKGFLPWHRLARATLSGELLFERSRFGPGDEEHGAAYAASCALQGGARAVLFSRWPAPGPLRDGLLTVLDTDRRGGGDTAPRAPLSQRLAEAQRLFLAGADGAPDPEVGHPRLWAPWLAFGE